ncbi:MAG TPA: alkaline phosphatase family protein [Nitrososphaeraceae archaeon]
MPKGKLLMSLIVLLIATSGSIWQGNYTFAQNATTTPIKHLVVIFQENVSFDHYFGTYPNASNKPGDPQFIPKSNTPSINGLSASILTDNPNKANPFLIPRSNASTCDNDHLYTRLQEAYNGGLLDKFVETNIVSKNCNPSITMGYFDGNTVTALWIYVQHFSMNDNFFGTIFGSSTPGHINLISGQTHGATPQYLNASYKGQTIVYVSNGTLISDANPLYDKCSNPATKSFPLASMNGINIGDLLNIKNVTWGWFQGGFKPTNMSAGGNPICGSAHVNSQGTQLFDYLPHHQPFQYYRTTANPDHLPPTSVKIIGHTDQANHQYDISDFWDVASSGNLPSVSFLKAPAFQDGHAGYSNPLEEQTFIVDTLNRIQNLSQWNSTSVIIAYDDSDGWYDHVMPPIISQSDDPNDDALLGKNLCGKPSPEMYKDRCGHGPRLPIIIVSPFSKVNYVDHQIIDQTSILKFIEDNWNLGRIGDQSFDVRAGSILNMFNFTAGHFAGKLFLNPENGTTISSLQ